MISPCDTVLKKKYVHLKGKTLTSKTAKSSSLDKESTLLDTALSRKEGWTV